MKLLFVITTLCAEVRYKVKEQLNGISYLIKLLIAIHDKAHKKPGSLSVSFVIGLSVKIDLLNNFIF